MKTLLLALAPMILTAGTLTPWNPTTHAGEQSVDTIIAPWEAIGYERISDDLDNVLGIPGYGDIYVLMFEDLLDPFADWDYNDAVFQCSWVDGCFLWAEHAAAYHEWEVIGTPEAWTVTLNSFFSPGVGMVSSNVALNFDTDGRDHVITWGIPVPVDPTQPVPEPATVVLMGLGLLGLAWRRIKR